MGLLVYFLGAPALAGVAVMLCLMPVEARVSSAAAAYRRKILRHTDSRIQIISELLAGAKMIKLCGWETAMAERVGAVREKELAHIRGGASLAAVNQALLLSSTVVVAIASFATYSLLGRGVLTPSTAFTALALFNQLGHPVKIIPKVIKMFSEVFVTTARLQRYLFPELSEGAAAELPPPPAAPAPAASATSTTAAPAPAETAAVAAGAPAAERELLSALVALGRPAPPPLRAAAAASEGPRLELSGASFGWGGSDAAAAVAGLTFVARPGEMTLLYGRVGSGKSTAIMGVLGDAALQAGSVTLRGRVAFAPQAPWIFNASLVENVVCGRPMERARLREVLAACCLEEDIAALPEGELTEIGERGVTLSGGQKARLALARALYDASASVVLVDDPLTALDNATAARVMEGALLGLAAARGSVLLVASSQPKLLARAHQVVALEAGAMAGVGTVQQLLARGVALVGQGEEHDSGDGSSQPGESAAAAAAAQEGAGAGAAGAKKNGKPTVAEAAAGPSAAGATSGGSKPGGRLLGAERRVVGDLPAEVFLRYFLAAGGGMSLLVLGMFLAKQSLDVLRGVILAAWSAAATGPRGGDAPPGPEPPSPFMPPPLAPDSGAAGSAGEPGFVAQLLLGGPRSPLSGGPFSLAGGGPGVAAWGWPGVASDPLVGYLAVYCLVGFAVVLLTGLRTVSVLLAGLNAAGRLHAAALRGVLCSGLQFFEQTPAGRVIVRPACCSLSRARASASLSRLRARVMPSPQSPFLASCVCRMPLSLIPLLLSHPPSAAAPRRGSPATLP